MITLPLKFDAYKKYSDLVADCPIKELGEKINYYYADDIKLNISMNNLIDLDMKSAFPNICKILWPDSDFVNILFNIESKLEKNIFLTNELIKHKAQTGVDYLVLLNNYAKMFVLGHIYNIYSDIQIFEFKKDGVLFKGVPINGCVDEEFNAFIDGNFKFHEQSVSQYYRLAHIRTSIYRYDDGIKNIQLKGQIKQIPEFINSEFFNDILINDVYSKKLSDFKQIYSLEYYQFLKKLRAIDKIKDYYLFNSKSYLQFNNKLLENDNKGFDPCFTLYNFIYPILALARNTS